MGPRTLPAGTTSTGLLLIFLAWMVCLCGGLSYLHVVSLAPAASPEGQQSLVHGVRDVDQSADYDPSVLTPAVLSLVLAGAALYTLLRRSYRGVRRIFRDAWQSSPSGVPLPCWVPPRVRLQVFLL